MVFEDSRTSTQSSKIFTLLILFSILVHLILLHQFRWFKPEEKPKEQLIEVELLKPIKQIPPKTYPKRGSSKEESQLQKRTAQLKKSDRNSKQTPQKATLPKKTPSLKKNIPKPKLQKPTISVKSALKSKQPGSISNSESPLSQKQLTIPILDTKNAPTSTPIPSLPSPESPLNKASLSQQKPDIAAKAKDVKVNSLIRKELDKEIQSPFQTRKDLAEESGQRQTGSSGKGIRNPASGTPNGIRISGEISSRKLIYTPPPPKLELDQDVKIRLQFTVLPNGEVDQVFPVQKANPELERAAIEMLHQYRFEALFESELVQSGSIEVILKR